MNRKHALAIVPAALALLLSSCGGGTTLDHGYVVAKSQEPAQTFTQIIPIYSGSVNGVPIFTYIPYTVHDDADWILDLDTCPHGLVGDNCQNGRLYTDQAHWDRAKIGDLIGSPVAVSASTSDPNQETKQG